MKTGDTRYIHVKQIKRNGAVIGNLCMLGRQYGYIIQLHYYAIPGYAINAVFESENKAERFFNRILAEVEK